MLTFLALTLLLQHSLCCNTSSVLFQEVFEYHDETYSKAEYAYEVVNKIYGAFRQWFFTITFCEFTYFENRILKYTENMDDGYPVLLLNGCPDKNKTRVKPRIDKHGQTAYVVTSEKFTIDISEYVIHALVRTGVFKPRSAVIFVLNVPIKIDSYFYYAMINHFQLLWSQNIANSVLILWSDKLRMYSYNPFSDQISDITEVKDVSRLLSRRYDDLYGHELRLSVFRKIYISDETGPVDCHSKLTETVMKRMNATCKPLLPRDGNTVGDLLENGIATGVTSDLMDGYTDLELNSRVLKDSYYGYIDTSYPLIQDALCFLVKKSRKQSTFTTTMKLISTNLLLLFVFTVTIFILTALLARKLEDQIWSIRKSETAGNTVIVLTKCFIRQTVDIAYIGPVFRCIILMVIVYSLIIDCVIDGVITSAVTYPRYKSDIDTSSDLNAANLTLGIHNMHSRIFNRSINSDFLSLENPVEIFDDKKIKEVINERQFQYAVLLRKSDALYISRQPSNMKDGRPLFHTMAECPLPCFIVYGLRYGSPYLSKLNNILQYLNQAGILQYWLRTEEYKLNKNILTEGNKDLKPLTMDNLQEVFLVWLVALFMSTIVFIIEILFQSLSKINITSMK